MIVVKIETNNLHEMYNMEFLSFADVFESESFTKVKIDTADFPIQVKTMTGLLHTITVNPDMTVLELKHLIEKIENYTPDQQRIVYSGKQLTDDNHIKDYPISSNAMLHLIIRLRGGMYHETSSRKDNELLQCTLLKEIESIERLLNKLK
jgi:hypothetical protein